MYNISNLHISPTHLECVLESCKIQQEPSWASLFRGLETDHAYFGDILLVDGVDDHESPRRRHIIFTKQSYTSKANQVIIYSYGIASMNMSSDEDMSSVASTAQTRFVQQALAITSQEWSRLGMDGEQGVATTGSIEILSERVTSLILIRLVALASPSDMFSDLSSATVCNTLLQGNNISSVWPTSISETVIQELRRFVRTMLNGYNDVPYHNFEHAYHVLISCNKLMDLALQSTVSQTAPGSSGSLCFDEDPLMHLALLFSALIHDVEHQGVPNKQLVIENNPLAIQYNDQSVAEQRSLTIGFSELLKSDYDNLREAMFPLSAAGDVYRRFREAVTNLILATDIATPERSDVVKEKWKQAFQGKKRKKRNSKPSLRGMLEASKKTNISTPSLPPPREHPTPMRSKRRSVVDKKPQAPSTKMDLLQDSWVELGATPSTHFPRKTGGSMHESMLFWWFCPSDNEEDDDADSFAESSVHSFATDTIGTTSATSLDMSNPNQLENSLHLSQGALVDIEAPLNDELTDKFYPSAQSMEFNNSNTGTEDLQHLLTPSKVNRLKRTISQCSSKTASSDTPRQLQDEAGVYCDLNRSDDDLSASSSRSKPKGLLCALSSCASMRWPRTKSREGIEEMSIAATVDTQGKTTPKDSNDSTSLAPTIDESVSSPGTTQAKPKLPDHRNEPASLVSKLEVSKLDVSTRTATTATSFTASSSKLPFDASANESLASFGDNPCSGVADEEFSVPVANEEDTAPLAGEEKEEEEEVDEKLVTMSMLEHILLVADVSHNMQSWDNMLKFSHRLSKEIQKSITAGRSGGILDDPLSDWYTNQSGFLHGYIRPLADRFEQIGCLPTLEVDESDESSFSPISLTKMIDANVSRWQEEGHDVIIEWRRLRAKAKNANKKLSLCRKIKKTGDIKTKKKSKRRSSTKSKGDKPKRKSSIKLTDKPKRRSSTKSSDAPKRRSSTKSTDKPKRRSSTKSTEKPKRRSSTKPKGDKKNRRKSCDAPGSKLEFAYNNSKDSKKVSFRKDVMSEQVLAPFGRLMVDPDDYE